MATDKLVDFDHVTDYISREAAIDVCDDDGDITRIRYIPAADVWPVVVAHWEWDENGMDWNLGAWKCSNCRRKAETWWANDKHNPLRCAGSYFCGNCGAEMREPNLDATKGDNHD